MSIFFSAAQLSKMSAAQICYMRGKPKQPVSDRVNDGNIFAAQHSVSEMIEMQGSFVHRDMRIYFTVDEIRNIRHRSYFVEHKLAIDPEVWFFRSSVIQTAFYGALAANLKTLKTAKWARVDGVEHTFEMHPHVHSLLNFGGRYYKITFDQEMIMRFFLTKARASLGYDTARQFDATYKFKEWEYFKEFVRFRHWPNAGNVSLENGVI